MRIALENVEYTSIGYTYESRTFVLWVLGQAGWYDVRPSKEYRGIFNDMCHVIALRFFVEEWHYPTEPKPADPADPADPTGPTDATDPVEFVDKKASYEGDDEIFEIVRQVINTFPVLVFAH